MIFDTSSYPRPDFVRADCVSLDGQWDFSFDTDILDKKLRCRLPTRVWKAVLV